MSTRPSPEHGPSGGPSPRAAQRRPSVNGDEARRVIGELAISAAGIGTFDWDLVTQTLEWDDQLIELFGYDTVTFDRTINAFDARVHTEDLPRVHRAMWGAIDAGGEYAAEYRIVLPGGETRWVAARGRVLTDEDGRSVRLLGAAYDTTARQDGEARVARVLESMPSAFYSLNRDWEFTYVNAAAERLLGRRREELVGGVVWDLFPAALDSDFESSYRHAMATGQDVTFDAYYPAPLNGWFELRAWPGPDGLSVYFVDITSRRAAQAVAEAAVRRAALLAEVTTEVAETLDAEEAVGRLAQLVVPALADWCVVTLVDDVEHAEALRGLRGLRDIGSWHSDPEQRERVARYAALRLDALTEGSFLGRAFETGQAVTLTDHATDAIRSVLEPGPARDVLTELAPETALVLPLRGRGRTVGILSLFNGAKRGPISDEALTTAQEVAGRSGLALDNARLYRQQLRLAEGLQRSLLTAPPEPDHVQICVRYEPAAEAAQVGGDWYDAFLQPDGATVLVIGDVVGHDVTAAAAMGQIRSLVRGIAVATGVGPADLLRGVDKAMRTLQAETVATAVVARIEQRADELERGITNVRWSNAGHPPPMVIHPDGTVAAMLGIQSDLLLGILPETQRVESKVTLDRGSTILLYTDGLVERRDRGLAAGMAELRDTLEQLSHLELDALCDEVLRRMLPARPADDVALVAVRLHRQDRPRPAEAGPNDVPPDVPDPPPSPPQAG
ncbi:SpoIIE family protein phosphatase [Actinotalea sp. K2]|uniref:SpoIIE family protein phosphatase n=1 Tax=Actinotalea sp. K2 TaxID=2939438 RepID=UPI0020172603|nr:SpoIIE family protein phosphatase [Actinotalea sp. K2]MCL3862582.1 SpoIIE family protein phosphatase [Actinotalea sp. K2]